MKTLVTGGTGFAGSYLCDLLRHKSYEVVATAHSRDEFSPPFEDHSTKILKMDISDFEQVRAVFESVRPNFVFHLAAKTFVPAAFKDPYGTYQVNTRGTMNLLEVMRSLSWDPRLVYVSTSAVYGKVGSRPISEIDPANPDNPYAVSKRAAELMVLQYVQHYNLDAVIARPFSHIGVGQSTDFVVGAFVQQIAAIAAGNREPKILVGNVKAVRDFTDVHDVVRAYELMAQNGKRGEIFNLCSGQGIAIKELLNILRGFVVRKIEVKGDRKLFRPSDVPVFIGNPEKARHVLHWRPEYNIKKTLREIFDYFLDLEQSSD
ncbi:GDP-mannose 4,6-dehydratase [Planctomycetota bacterium]